MGTIVDLAENENTAVKAPNLEHDWSKTLWLLLQSTAVRTISL